MPSKEEFGRVSGDISVGVPIAARMTFARKKNMPPFQRWRPPAMKPSNSTGAR